MGCYQSTCPSAHQAIELCGRRIRRKLEDSNGGVDGGKEVIERLFGKPGEPVPAVDFADMKAMKAVMEDVNAGFPQGGTMAHITNRKDAIKKLMLAVYLFAYPDGTFETPDEVTFSKQVFEELEKEGRIRMISGDATTALYKYMPIAGWGRHITNRKDAIAELTRDRYLHEHADGTIVNPDGVAFSREVFEDLKSTSSIVLVAVYSKEKIAVYKYVADLDWWDTGASHYHEHD